MGVLQNLVEESAQAKEQLNDLDLNLQSMLWQDDTNKRDGQQKIWELTKSLQLEKAQHEALLSRKRSLSSAVEALEKQRDELGKREAQARAAFQRAHQAAGRESRGRIAASRALERVRTTAMMLQAQLHDVLKASRDVAHAVHVVACPQCASVPTAVVVELDLNASMSSSHADTLSALCMEAGTSPDVTEGASSGWQDTEAAKAEIVRHLTSLIAVEPGRLHVVRVNRNGRALVLVDMPPQANEVEEGRAGNGAREAELQKERYDNAASTAHVLRALWQPAQQDSRDLAAGEAEDKLGPSTTSMVCWEGPDGSFTVTTRPITSIGHGLAEREGDETAHLGSGNGNRRDAGATLSSLRRVEKLVKNVLDRVSRPLRPEPLQLVMPGGRRSDATLSEASESEAVSQDEQYPWIVERDELGGGYVQRMSGLDYMVWNEHDGDEESVTPSALDAQGDLVIRDHRLPYDNVDDADKSSAVFPRGRNNARGAAGGWIERRLCGFSPTAGNTPQAAAWEDSVSENGGLAWVSFGGEEDEAETAHANTTAAGTALGEWSALSLKSGAQELTDILDAAALRKGLVSQGNEGEQHDDNDDDLEHTGRSHVIEEPCLIPSISVSTHHRKGALPSSANHKENMPVSASQHETSGDYLPPPVTLTEIDSDWTLDAKHKTLPARALSSSGMPAAQNGEGGQRKQDKPEDKPIYLSSSWAAALVFDPIESSPPRVQEAEPSDQASRCSRVHSSSLSAARQEDRPAGWTGLGIDVDRRTVSGAGSYGSVLGTDDDDDDNNEKKLDSRAMLSFIDPVSSIHDSWAEELFAATPVPLPAGQRIPHSSSDGSVGSSDLSTKLLDTMLKRSDLDWMVLPALDVCEESQDPDEDAAYEAMLRERSAEIQAELEAEREHVIREGGNHGSTFTARLCARQVLRDRKRLSQIKRSPNANRNGRAGEEEAQESEPRQGQGEGDGPENSHKDISVRDAPQQRLSPGGKEGGTGTFVSHHLLTSWTHVSEREGFRQQERESENGSAMGTVDQAEASARDLSRRRDSASSRSQESSLSNSRGAGGQDSAAGGAKSAARTRGPRPIGAQWMPSEK